MQYRKDKYGNDISALGYGCMRFTKKGNSADLDKAEKEVMAAIEAGVNYFDTAYVYAGNEVAVGEILHRNHCREKINLATKLPHYLIKSIDSVEKMFQEELRRLQTDYIDLGMIHYVDSEEEWEQIQHSDYLDYVMELKNSGIIHHIGMSSHNPKVAMKAAESGFVEMILFSINPAFDMLPASENIDTMFADEFDTSLKGIDADRARLYKVCEENDVGITVMKGFAGGRLFDEKRSPFGVSLTPIQCIHYALTRPAVCSIMCGYDTKEQVEAAVAYETASEEEKDYASVIANAPFHSYRGECTYCGHCKPCVSNLDIAMINKFYDLATMQPEVPATIQSHYELLEHKASECIACRACEKRCPFGVPIAERMEKTAKLFGC